MAVSRLRAVLLTWSSRMWMSGIAIACAGSGCGADGRYVVIGSARAAAASGTIEVDELDSNSTQVAVHLEHLYPPNRLGRSLTRYGVWFVPPTGAPVWGGELKFDRDERTADLTATSPFRRFGVRITAEAADRSSVPSPVVVASQEIALD
jgi:hypothetical protein